MLENLMLIFIALATVLFIGLLWLRYSLLHLLSLTRACEQILQSDFDKRRDVLPYLLEGARALEEPSDSWRKLVEDRCSFQTLSNQLNIQRELDFERTLNSYLQNTSLRGVHFLDAKKDIEKLSHIIEKEKVALRDSVLAFNEQRKIFPYSLASAIFGFRALGLSAEPNLLPSDESAPPVL